MESYCDCFFFWSHQTILRQTVRGGGCIKTISFIWSWCSAIETLEIGILFLQSTDIPRKTGEVLIARERRIFVFRRQPFSFNNQHTSFTWSETVDSIRYLTWADRRLRCHWSYLSVSTTTIWSSLWKMNNKTRRHQRFRSQGDNREYRMRCG